MREVSRTSPTRSERRGALALDQPEEGLALLLAQLAPAHGSVCAQPMTEAIGPRSSWETMETKSARSAESRRISSAALRSASYMRMFSTAEATWRASSGDELVSSG